MADILNSLQSFWSLILSFLSVTRFADLLDIAIVAFIIYQCIKFFRETRAGQLIKGIAVLIIVWLFAQWLNLLTMKWIIFNVFNSAIIATVIIFQPEIRRGLERVGRTSTSSFGRSDGRENLSQNILSVCKACASLQDQNIGALIIFERNTLLGEAADTGTIIDADIDNSLIVSLFFPNSPLHDGAMIIREGKIYAVGCILPLSSEELSSSLGTRHRAGIGITENSDAIAIIVSEETGTISIAINGKITRNYDPVTLRSTLNNELLTQNSEKRGLRNFLKRGPKDE